MTPVERANPVMIDGSRRARIAAGSGTAPGDVSALIKQFQDVKKMMQKMGNIPGLGRKMKKGKKGKSGGRVTPKGTKPVTAGKPPPFSIPGIGEDGFPGLN
jgi:signal recognition particle subunit SRP54